MQKQFSFNQKLTDVEILAKSKELASAISQKESLTDELKSIKSEFKSKIESQESIIGVLSNQIATGKEWTTKMCDVILDHKKGIKTFMFEGEIVGESKMEAYEYQTKIEE